VKVLIWGAGAIGGTLGAYFVRAGHDVTLVDTVAEHVEVIADRGLSITGPIETFSVSVPAFTPDQLSGRWDNVLLCTKAHHTETALNELLPHLTKDGYVVSVQNGLNEQTLADKLGAAYVIGAFVNFGADYQEPGVIHYGGRGAVVLGELDGQATPRLKALHELFLTFDGAAVTTPNIWGYLWGKLAYGAMLFATALTNASIADALDHPEYRTLYIALGREVLHVAAALNVQPEAFNGFDPQAFMPDTPEATSQRSIDEMVAFNRRSAKTHSGIWRDLAVRKRRTEVDPQLGAIVQAGQRVGVATPITEKLIELIHDVEDGRRAQGWDALGALRHAQLEHV